jgi:phage terminase large subunit GpA-like protein
VTFFQYRNNQLYAEDVAAAEIAAQFGTPCYVYSQSALENAFQQYSQAFAGHDHLVCYAMKANSNLSILKLFASLGAGFDIVSGGELQRVLAIGADRRSMVVEAMFIAGETSDPERGAFAELTQIYHRDYADAFGKRRRVDLFGVDSGYRSNVVYSWVRGRPGAMALKGLDGWSRPALGMATLVDVDFGGHKVKNGATVWGVGTWPLKATLYADLRKSGRSGGAEVDPPGFCHFGTWLDEIYFRQLTSEYLGEEKHRGRTRKVWKVRYGEENHFFDCRVYNMALADFLGLSRLAPEQWAELARERGVPAAEADLLSPAPIALQAASVSQPVKAEAAAVPTAQPEDSGDWLKGRRWKL